jgi:hypothetical protein
VVSFFLLWNPIASSQSQLHHSHFYFCSVLWSILRNRATLWSVHLSFPPQSPTQR